MKLPYLKGNGAGKTQQVMFGGYDHNQGAQDGAIWDMGNMSSDHFPLLAPRNKRKIKTTLTAPNGIIGGNALAWVDGTSFYYDGVSKGTVSNSDKDMASIGDKIVIFPDKKYFDLNTDTFGDLEEAYISLAGEITFRDGSFADEVADANCIETSGDPFGFEVGDAVRISGANSSKNNSPYIVPIIREISDDKTVMRFYENTFDLETSSTYDEKILPGDKDSIASVDFCVGSVNPGLSGGTFTVSQTTSITISESGATTAVGKYYINKATLSGDQTGDTMYEVISAQFSEGRLYLIVKVHYAARKNNDSGVITIKREVPDLKYVFEHDNRLWGVDEGSIRCCKLGNPKVWDDFEGLAGGCWQVDVGSSGEFTGAISYQNHPIFFKEKDMYEVYGHKPSNFQFMRAARVGVMSGSERSLSIAGETLFYQSRQGIMAYAGGLPANISVAFGDVQYGDGVAGSDGKKYYISMSDGTNSHLFVYDTQKRMWHREDDTDAKGFAYTDDLYMLTEAGDIVALDPQNATGMEESAVEWYVEFGDLTDNSPNKKGVYKYQLRLDVEIGASCTVKASYDGGEYKMIKTINPGGKQSYCIPFAPRRADYYRLKLEGSGEVKIYSLVRERYAGSEI